MAEWPIAAVLKTAVGQPTVGSNPTSSVFYKNFTQKVLMHSWEALQTALPLIEEKLGYTFVNKNLLLLAFVHRSYVNENKDKADKHNERLEFLGDSVLGLIVADHLYIDLPFQPEGHLSFIRSRLVEASSCVAYMQKLGACDFVLLCKGEKMNGGK